MTLVPVVGSTPCTFATGLPPDDPHDGGIYHIVGASLNQALVSEDDVDGWNYGPTTASIVFAGTSCDSISSDPQNSVVQIICACGLPPI